MTPNPHILKCFVSSPRRNMALSVPRFVAPRDVANRLSMVNNGPMSPREEEIAHVSDTALLVAACRAMETAHPIGIVRDPFAERLAGARGMAIARAFPFVETMRFGVGVRCRF